jgi:hypothetical protein
VVTGRALDNVGVMGGVKWWCANNISGTGHNRDRRDRAKGQQSKFTCSAGAASRDKLGGTLRALLGLDVWPRRRGPSLSQACGQRVWPMLVARRIDDIGEHQSGAGGVASHSESGARGIDTGRAYSATGMVPRYVSCSPVRIGLAGYAWRVGRSGQCRMVPRHRACPARASDMTRPSSYAKRPKVTRKAKAKGHGTGTRDTGPLTNNPDMALIQRLHSISENENSSAQARVSALRTALEVSGALGRHARKPQDTELSLSPGVLTRAGLERELMRLRRVVMPGTEG